MMKLATFSLFTEMRQKEFDMEGMVMTTRTRENAGKQQQQQQQHQYKEQENIKMNKVKMGVVINPQDIEFVKAKILRIQSCIIETKLNGNSKMEIFQVTTMMQRRNNKEPDYVIFEKSQKNPEWKICGRIKKTFKSIEF